MRSRGTFPFYDELTCSDCRRRRRGPLPPHACSFFPQPPMRTSAFVTAAFLTTLYCVSGGPPCPSSCDFDTQLQKCKCAPKKLLLNDEKELLLKHVRKWKTQVQESSTEGGRTASTTTASINVTTPSAVTLSTNMEAVESLCGGDNCDRWRTPHGGVGCRCPMRTRENPPIDLGKLPQETQRIENPVAQQRRKYLTTWKITGTCAC